MQRSVLLDRDGTLVTTYPQDGLPDRGPRTSDQIVLLPGVFDGCRRLKDAGYLLILITNQPDIVRGLTTEPEQMAINRALAHVLQLNDVYMCPHDGDWCACRKPRPGLIWAAAVAHELTLAQCWMIGNSDNDYNAAISAGVTPLLVSDDKSFDGRVQWILDHSK